MSPATIKNYRAELDPYFPNRRRSWHQRPLRLHCKAVLEKYGEMSLPELAARGKTLFDPTADLVKAEPKQEHGEETEQSSFAKRLITGRAAEGFFRANNARHEEWRGGNVVDATATGCGFDFRINFADATACHAVEVKGMFDSRGNIMLTEKEHRRADQFRDRYFLYVVRNFREVPFASIWRDPLNSDLKWDLLSQQQTIKLPPQNQWLRIVEGMLSLPATK